MGQISANAVRASIDPRVSNSVSQPYLSIGYRITFQVRKHRDPVPVSPRAIPAGAAGYGYIGCHIYVPFGPGYSQTKMVLIVTVIYDNRYVVYFLLKINVFRGDILGVSTPVTDFNHPEAAKGNHRIS